MDEKILLNYSIKYLSKYDTSKKNLKYVLKRKIYRMKIRDIEKNSLQKSIESILNKLERNNFINDNRYLLSKITYLSKSGKSRKYILNYLLKKGLDRKDVEFAFSKFSENNLDWEISSAKLFAKRKKLINSSESYEKKLSKMARAGFSYETSKKILG
tara:strand:- start:443 stop:913 length:471 start_codon:yes stop_codon:yes gene_type:complete